MKLEIKEKKENKLLSRTEISGTISFDKATPSNEDVAKEIAKQMKTSEDKIKVKQILTRFGDTMADFNAYAYTSKEELDRIEPQPKKWLEKEKKKAEAKAKAAEEAKPKEAPKEEKKEVPKEEKPAEEKKEEKPKVEEKEAPKEKPKAKEEKPAEEKKEEKPAEEAK